MPENLLVGVLGNRDSGKSHTWNTLFGRVVRTGRELRPLLVAPGEYVDVFLVSGSPEERREYVGDLIVQRRPRIVLCSIQFVDHAGETIGWFVEHDYFLFVHWLNPGHNDRGSIPDELRLCERIMSEQSLLGVRNGRVSANARVEEMRDFIYGWARSRNLIYDSN
jgi:hypothetical protein